MAEAPEGLRDIAFEDIEAAARRIAGRVARTPLLHSRAAAREIELRTGVRIGGEGMPDRPGGDPAPGADEPRLFLKGEHLQVTGSFKARGAVNRVLTLTAEERATIAAQPEAEAIVCWSSSGDSQWPATAAEADNAPGRPYACARIAYSVRGDAPTWRAFIEQSPGDRDIPRT